MVSGASLNDQLAHGSVICDKAGTSWRQDILEQRYLLYRNKETKGVALKKNGERERGLEREHKPFKSHSLSDPLLTWPPGQWKDPRGQYWLLLGSKWKDSGIRWAGQELAERGLRLAATFL